MNDGNFWLIVYICLPVIVLLLGWIASFLYDIRNALWDIRNKINKRDRK